MMALCCTPTSGLIVHAVSFSAVEFCQREWANILLHLKNSQCEGGKEWPGGDGGDEGGGRIINIRKR